jgi:hypothetical protein
MRYDHDFKKTGSYKILSNTNNIKLYSTCKSSYNNMKDITQDNYLAKSLKKLRKNINYTNP